MTIEDNSEPYSLPLPGGGIGYAVRQTAPAQKPVMTLRGRTDGQIEILVDGRPLSDAGLFVQNLKVEVDAAGGTTVRLQCPFERVELDLSGPGTVFRRQTDGDQMRRVAAAIQAESAGYASRAYVSDVVPTELERSKAVAAQIVGLPAEDRSTLIRECEAAGLPVKSVLAAAVVQTLDRSKAVAERAGGVVKDFQRQQFYAPNLGEPHMVVAGGYAMESTEFVSPETLIVPGVSPAPSVNFGQVRHVTAPNVPPPPDGTDPWRCTMPSRYPVMDDAGSQVGWSDGSPFDADGLARALRDAAPADDDGFEGPRIVEGSP